MDGWFPFYYQGLSQTFSFVIDLVLLRNHKNIFLSITYVFIAELVLDRKLC